MEEVQERLADVLRQTARIFEASVLVSEVRFIIRGADLIHVRCRVWFDIDQGQYRYDLSHEAPEMVASGTPWAGSPEGALELALERLVGSGRAAELVANPFFDDPNSDADEPEE